MKKLNYGMVGGGPGSFIGDAHRKAINIDAMATLVAGCFSRTLERSGPYLKEGQAVAVQGKLSVRDEKAPQIMCDSAYPLSAAEGGLPPRAAEKPKGEKLLEGDTLFLKFPSITDPAVRHMKLVFNMFPGTTRVKMVMADTRKVYATQVLLHKALVEEAKETLGEENVVIK